MDLERKHLRLPVQSRVFIELESEVAGSDADSNIGFETKPFHQQTVLYL